MTLAGILFSGFHCNAQTVKSACRLQPHTGRIKGSARHRFALSGTDPFQAGKIQHLSFVPCFSM